MNIEIIKNIDNLNREVFEFYCYIENFSNIIFGLDNYHIEKRETTRKKFKAIKKWERLSKRKSNIDKPIIPDDVVIEAKNKIISLIKYVV